MASLSFCQDEKKVTFSKNIVLLGTSLFASVMTGGNEKKENNGEESFVKNNIVGLGEELM